MFNVEKMNTFKNKVRKFKSGGTGETSEKAKFGLADGLDIGATLAQSVLPKDEGLQNVKGNNVKQAGREAGNQVANMIVPGLGSAMSIGQSVGDAMKTTECDEVTGECFDITTGGKKIAANILDPVGSVTNSLTNVANGDFGGAVDSLTFGLTNFSNKDEANIEKMRNMKKEREMNKIKQESNVLLNKDKVARLNKFASMGDNFGFNQTYKQGGLISSNKVKSNKK